MIIKYHKPQTILALRGDAMICDTIKELRERAGLSQSALAKKVGVTRSAVNAWEMGLSIPTTQYVAELAQLFHVSADYMLGLDHTEAVYIGNLSEDEKHILYSLLNYFHDK